VAGLNGKATPTRRIAGFGPLYERLGLAVDATRQLFVGRLWLEHRYGLRGVNGNAVPRATIAGASTGPNRPAYTIF
jgi:hypothetical protein